MCVRWPVCLYPFRVAINTHVSGLIAGKANVREYLNCTYYTATFNWIFFFIQLSSRHSETEWVFEIELMYKLYFFLKGMDCFPGHEEISGVNAWCVFGKVQSVVSECPPN